MNNILFVVYFIFGDFTISNFVYYTLILKNHEHYNLPMGYWRKWFDLEGFINNGILVQKLAHYLHVYFVDDDLIRNILENYAEIRIVMYRKIISSKRWMDRHNWRYKSYLIKEEDNVKTTEMILWHGEYFVT